MTMPLPKEEQTAYQRWELASFGDDRASTQHHAETNAKLDAQAEAQRQQEIAAEREAARQQGYQKGHQEGHQEGLSKGYEDGLKKGRAQAEKERALLQQLAQNFGQEIANANELISADVLALAFDVAKAMLKTALPAKPELILPVVKETINYLPTVQQPALLILHPADAALVRSQMEQELAAAGWRIVEDPQMERGGCRVETASNQIDATTPTRWQRIATALSADNSWMDA